MANGRQVTHKVERTLRQSVLALGRELMQAFFEALRRPAAETAIGDHRPEFVLSHDRQ